jgi:hypothetical protein
MDVVFHSVIFANVRDKPRAPALAADHDAMSSRRLTSAPEIW